jgi:hypothetical protein
VGGAHHFFGADISFAGYSLPPAQSHLVSVFKWLQLPCATTVFTLLCPLFPAVGRDPLAVLLEMKRVTRPGGNLVCWQNRLRPSEDQPTALQKIRENCRHGNCSPGCPLDVRQPLQASFKIRSPDVHVSKLKPAPTKHASQS